MSQVCYEEYVTHRRSRKETWKIVKARFPDKAPSTPDDLKVYARRYAGRHGKPCAYGGDRLTCPVFLPAHQTP